MNFLSIPSHKFLVPFLQEQAAIFEVAQDSKTVSIAYMEPDYIFNLGYKFAQYCNRLENRMTTLGQLEKDGELPPATKPQQD